MILIDGHNLIPKIPGLSLGDFDDEMKLIEMLQVYARIRRKRLEVFFDKAPAGQALQRSYGTIQARFARPGLPADEEIRLRLESLGNKARQYKVVSSDQRVQTYARAARAQVITSDDFARQIIAAAAGSNDIKSQSPEQLMNEHEIDMWLKLFNDRGGSQKD